MPQKIVMRIFAKKKNGVGTSWAGKNVTWTRKNVRFL